MAATNWFNFDKSSKVKNANGHVSAYISAIKSGASVSVRVLFYSSVCK